MALIVDASVAIKWFIDEPGPIWRGAYGAMSPSFSRRI
jgi:hypothetical protein